MRVRVTQEHMAAFRVGGVDAEVAEIPLADVVLLGCPETTLEDNVVLSRRLRSVEQDNFRLEVERDEIADQLANLEKHRDELVEMVEQANTIITRDQATIRRLADENAALRYMVESVGLHIYGADTPSVQPPPCDCATVPNQVCDVCQGIADTPECPDQEWWQRGSNPEAEADGEGLAAFILEDPDKSEPAARAFSMPQMMSRPAVFE